MADFFTRSTNLTVPPLTIPTCMVTKGPKASSPCQGHLLQLKRPWQLAHSFLIFWLLDPACPPSVKRLKSLFLPEGESTVEYKLSSQVGNINECDCVSVLNQRFTAILTSSVWKAKGRTGLRDRRQCPVQIPSLYKSVHVVQFLDLKITFGKLCFQSFSDQKKKKARFVCWTSE